jgi:hypothetical protein
MEHPVLASTRGSLQWSEKEPKALEIGVVGGFATPEGSRGLRSFPQSEAPQRAGSAMCELWRERRNGSSDRLPTPSDLPAGHHRRQCRYTGYVAWLGRLIPGRFGTIEQDDIGRAFVAEFMDSSAADGVVCLENVAMRQRSSAVLH